MASPASGSPQVSQDSASQGSALSPPPRQPPLSFSPGGNWLPKQGGPGEEEAGTTPGIPWEQDGPTTALEAELQVQSGRHA